MMQLIRYEWKKIISKKINVVLILCLLCLPFIELLFGLHTIEINGSNPPVLIKDAIQYDGLSALKKMDENLHAYAGEINEEWIKRIDSDREREIDEVYSTSSVDEDQMTKFYGENWNYYYELGKKGELTRGQINDLKKELGTFSWEEDDSAEARAMSTYINLRYTLESEIAESSIQNLFPYNYQADYYLHPENYLITQENIALRDAASQAKEQLMMDLISEDEWRRQAELVKPMLYPEGENEAINEYFNEQFLDKSLYYDSTVAADYYLNLFIWKNTFMPIKCILLGMLLLSIFNQEVSNKTDQIMKPMKVSIRKQSIAKYVTTILIAVGFAFYDIGVYIGFLQLTIGFHNLNVVFDTQLLNNIDGFVTPIYSYQQIMITCSLLYIVSTVFIASFIALLSSITKRSYTALIIYLIAITAMISIPYGYEAIIGTEMPYKLFLPLHMMCTDTVFKTLLSNYLVTIFNQNYFVIFDQVVFAPIIIIGVVLLISAVFFVIVIEYQSKREIKNA